jgi:hypothetical protein
MFRRTSTMPPEEVFTRTLVGCILIGSSFFSWGRWVSLALGILFLTSVLTGVCLTCILYKKFIAKNT